MIESRMEMQQRTGVERDLSLLKRTRLNLQRSKQQWKNLELSYQQFRSPLWGLCSKLEKYWCQQKLTRRQL
jgi:hypothetical protein